MYEIPLNKSMSFFLMCLGTFVLIIWLGWNWKPELLCG